MEVYFCWLERDASLRKWVWEVSACCASKIEKSKKLKKIREEKITQKSNLAYWSQQIYISWGLGGPLKLLSCYIPEKPRPKSGTFPCQCCRYLAMFILLKSFSEAGGAQSAQFLPMSAGPDQSTALNSIAVSSNNSFTNETLQTLPDKSNLGHSSTVTSSIRDLS